MKEKTGLTAVNIHGSSRASPQIFSRTNFRLSPTGIIRSGSRLVKLQHPFLPLPNRHSATKNSNKLSFNLEQHYGSYRLECLSRHARFGAWCSCRRQSPVSSRPLFVREVSAKATCYYSPLFRFSSSSSLRASELREAYNACLPVC